MISITNDTLTIGFSTFLQLGSLFFNPSFFSSFIAVIAEENRVVVDSKAEQREQSEPRVRAEPPGRVCCWGRQNPADPKPGGGQSQAGPAGSELGTGEHTRCARGAAIWE